MDELPYVRVLPFFEQAHALFSFTGKVFYRARVTRPQVSDAASWLSVEFIPAERFGAYNLDQETQRRYCKEFGETSADPACGPALYPFYHVLVDTGIIVVRGALRYLEVRRRDPDRPDVLAEGLVCDVADPRAS